MSTVEGLCQLAIGISGGAHFGTLEWGHALERFWFDLFDPAMQKVRPSYGPARCLDRAGEDMVMRSSDALLL